MNNKNISKLKFFFTGLISRFNEDNTLFKGVSVTYKSGLKTFNGIGSFSNNKIDYNFNGVKSTISISELLDSICIGSAKYDSVTVVYNERGVSTTLTCDNKNVKMTSR